MLMMKARAVLTVAVAALAISACGGPSVARLGEGEISGTGDAIGVDAVDLEVPGGEAAFLSFEIRNFTTFSLKLDGGVGYGESHLTNRYPKSRSTYTGTHFLEYLESGDLEIRASDDSDWRLRIEPLSAAPSIPASGRLQGTGDTVLVDAVPPSAPFAVAFTHSGASNFVVKAWKDGQSTLLANEIGPYEGRAVGIPAGTAIYDITADGDWTFEIEPPKPFNDEARDRFGVDGGVFIGADGRVEGAGRVTAEAAAQEGICLSATLEEEGRSLDLILAPGVDEIDTDGFADFAMETFCPWKFDDDDPRWRPSL